MQKLKMLRSFREYKDGEEIEVQNNEAHALIDAGYATKMADFIERVETDDTVRVEVAKVEMNPVIKEKPKAKVCLKCGREFATDRGLLIHSRTCKATKEMKPGKVSSYKTK